MKHKKTRCCKSELEASWKKIFERETEQLKHDNQRYVIHSSMNVNYIIGVMAGIVAVVIVYIIVHLVI